MKRELVQLKTQAKYEKEKARTAEQVYSNFLRNRKMITELDKISAGFTREPEFRVVKSPRTSLVINLEEDENVDQVRRVIESHLPINFTKSIQAKDPWVCHDYTWVAPWGNDEIVVRNRKDFDSDELK